MRKKIGLFFGLVALLIPNMVSAATELPNESDNVIKLTEDVTLAAGFVVESGKNITLDLAGFTLTTATGLKADTIYVEKGATLTIIGNGTVTVSTKGYATVFNNGTTIIKNGTFKRDTANGNDWYVICNHGYMTIDGGTVSVNGTNSSLVENGYANFTATNERSGYVASKNVESPKLTINGGTFDGGMNTIKNDDNAELIINDGLFQNNYQVAVMNWNIATINNGTFKTPTGIDKTNLFVSSAGADSVNKGILTINGGTFEAEHLLEGKSGVVTPVTITGGTFKYTDSLFNEAKTKVDFVNSGLTVSGEISAPSSIVKYATEGAIINLTKVELNDNLVVANGVEINLPTDKVGELAFVKNEDGTLSVVESADLTKLIEVLNKLNEIEANKNSYTQESFAKLYEIVEANSKVLNQPNFTKDEQNKVDDLVTLLNNAINALQKPVENPSTGDNIVIYAILGTISLLTMGYALKLKRIN